MEKSINSDLIRGHIDTIILKSLLDSDKFPQEISEFISNSSNNSYTINQATLYSSLKRLETTKLVRSYWKDSANGRRKFFSLTNDGKACVENKLLEWSQSREIIDNLMGTNSQKIVYVATNSVQNNAVNIASPTTNVVENIVAPTQNLEPKTENIVKTDGQKDGVDLKDVNYKSILSELISTTTPKKESTVIDEIVEKENIEKVEETDEMPKFNETISNTKYNGNSLNVDKIDFGDLALKASKEGYKLRISTKNSKKTTSGIFINKINFVSSLIIFALILFEFFIINIALKTQVFVYLFVIPAFALLVYSGLKYFIDKDRLSRKKIKKDSILISLIIIFNLILITCALNFFFGVDMFNLSEITYSLISPIILFLNGFVFVTIKYILSKKYFLNYSK